VSLYSDGTAKLATPPISSFAMVGAYYYSFTDGELLIYNESNEETARFEVVDDTTIIYRAATVPLFAEAGTRYLAAPEISDARINIDELYTLYSMRTPYVGDNSAVGKIVHSLPEIDREHTQRFFSIGDDYGTRYAPYTLTLYYEPTGAETDDIRHLTVTPKISALLFALIDNLEEINYAFRSTPSNGELDKTAYTSRVTYYKNDIVDYIGTIGLTWEDFQNDWSGSVDKMFGLALGKGDGAIEDSQVGGGAHLLSYRARVIEVFSEHSLIIEVLPMINRERESKITERDGDNQLLTGEIVKAVFGNDNERAAEFIAHISVDDVVNISYLNRANITFNYTTNPIIVECDGIDIYDTDGRTIMEYF
ncbi:MAG: DUF4825 domain-containing protein, partial [Oscillospiraceae bacterium]|nr:DUF4825 domain-containing protein [Oscillospiraceae bacterium]